MGLAPRAARIRFRMDGAFFREDVLRGCGREGQAGRRCPSITGWICSSTFRRQKSWTGVAKDVSGFVVHARHALGVHTVGGSLSPEGLRIRRRRTSSSICLIPMMKT